MVELEISNYDPVKLATWTLSELTAILFAVTLWTDTTPAGIFGSQGSAELAIGFGGAVAAVSLVQTYTTLG